MITMPEHIEKKVHKLCSLQGIPEHMHHAVTNYVLYGRAPGGFLQSVIESNLFSAYSKADLPNTKAMKNYVILFYNYLPSSCYGNEEAYKWYKEKGGLVGIYDERKKGKTNLEQNETDKELQNFVEQSVENWVDSQLQMLC